MRSRTHLAPGLQSKLLYLATQAHLDQFPARSDRHIGMETKHQCPVFPAKGRLAPSISHKLANIKLLSSYDKSSYCQSCVSFG